jgi:anti-anti-sigma factor
MRAVTLGVRAVHRSHVSSPHPVTTLGVPAPQTPVTSTPFASLLHGRNLKSRGPFMGITDREPPATAQAHSHDTPAPGLYACSVRMRGFTVVEPQGEIDLHTAPEVQQHLDAATAPAGARVIVDQRPAVFPDGVSLALLCRAQRLAHRQGVAASISSAPAPGTSRSWTQPACVAVSAPSPRWTKLPGPASAHPVAGTAAALEGCPGHASLRGGWSQRTARTAA